MNRHFSGWMKPALAAAALTFAFAGAPMAGANDAVKTPKSPGAAPTNEPPFHGKPSTNVMPDNKPLSPSEAGDPRPEQDHFRSGPPPGSAMAPNPKTPLSPNETAPITRQGSTAGVPESGRLDSRDRRDRTR